MNIGSSKSIWGHGGRFDGEEVSSAFPQGGEWGSLIPELQILDLLRLTSLEIRESGIQTRMSTFQNQ